MAKKKDLKDLGDVYSKLGEEVVVSEKNDMTVGDKDAAVGEAPLEDGGITKDCGCEDPEEVEAVEAEEVQGVKEEDEEVTVVNVPEIYRKALRGELKKLAIPHTFSVDSVEVGVDDVADVKTALANLKGSRARIGDKAEEDEENALKDAQGGINNYMAKKSAFDELFAKVISEDFGMEEQDDLNALGIEDATPDAELGEEGDDDAAGEEEVTITLDKELAQQLCDLLKAACGEEGDDAGDEDVADELEGEGGDEFGPEEDNEGAPQAHTAHVDMGTNNKVGNLAGDAFGSQPKVQAANKVATKPTAGHGSTDGKPSPLGDSVKNDQKVGAKTEGPTTTVQPKNKEVKAG